MREVRCCAAGAAELPYGESQCEAKGSKPPHYTHASLHCTGRERHSLSLGSGALLNAGDIVFVLFLHRPASVQSDTLV